MNKRLFLKTNIVFVTAFIVTNIIVVPARANLKAVYSVDKTASEVDKERKPLGDEKKVSSIEQTIIFSPNGFSMNGFSVEEAQTKTSYDFKIKRVISLEPKNKTYTDYSLYSVLYFRLMELQNRAGLREKLLAFAAKGMDTTPGKTYLETSYLKDQQTIFSLSMPQDTPVEIQTVQGDKGQQKFLWQNSIDVNYTPSAVALPQFLLPSYRHFLIYGCHIHPQIRQVISNNLFLPEELSFKFFNPPRRDELKTQGRGNYITVHLNLKDANDCADEFKIPSEYQRDYGDKLNPVFDAFKRLVSDGKLAPESEELDFINNAIEHGNKFDALLASLEYINLYGTEKGTKVMQAITQKYASPFKEYLSFLEDCETSGKSKEQCLVALKHLAAIDKSPLKKGYMIDVMQGNLSIKSGDVNAGQQFLINALIKNPRLVSAYCDLGNSLLSQYETPYAWECYDLAKKLSPQHSLLLPINDLEQNLQASFPDYF